MLEFLNRMLLTEQLYAKHLCTMRGDEERALTCCGVRDVDKGLLVLDHGAQGDGHMGGEHMPPQTFSAWWGGLHALAPNHIQVTYKCCATLRHCHHCDMTRPSAMRNNTAWSRQLTMESRVTSVRSKNETTQICLQDRADSNILSFSTNFS
jgi:hypothetical protein